MNAPTRTNRNRSKQSTLKALAGLSVPFFWPMTAAAALVQEGVEVYAKNLAFLAEEEKLHHEVKPHLASPNRILLDLRTMVLRDYSINDSTSDSTMDPLEAPARAPAGIPTIVDAPYAGHTAMIADYAVGQSLIETLMAHGPKRVYLTDWKSATPDMKDLEIDQYLAELNVCVDELGGRVNLVGLCQGGWMSAMYAARFPHKVASLVLAGSPIDTDAGDGPVKQMAHSYPLSFYEDMVAAGGGLMRGRFMLRGWKNMHPEQHYMQEHIDLYEHIDDPAYLRKEELFESWYENPIDLPGRWYLQAIQQLFKENRLAKGNFVALGRTLSLHDVTCPVYLLAGSEDDITTQEQVFDAAKYLGTAPDRIRRELVPGGHIGLFMGSRTLTRTWPEIAAWIAAAR